jgi:hypothetical protein
MIIAKFYYGIISIQSGYSRQLVCLCKKMFNDFLSWVAREELRLLGACGPVAVSAQFCLNKFLCHRREKTSIFTHLA